MVLLGLYVLILIHMAVPRNPFFETFLRAYTLRRSKIFHIFFFIKWIFLLVGVSTIHILSSKKFTLSSELSTARKFLFFAASKFVCFFEFECALWFRENITETYAFNSSSFACACVVMFDNFAPLLDDSPLNYWILSAQVFPTSIHFRRPVQKFCTLLYWRVCRPCRKINKTGHRVKSQDVYIIDKIIG